MSEAPAEQQNDTPAAEQKPPEGEPETFTREYVEGLRKENAKYRTSATEQRAAAQAAEKARVAALSDAERVVVEAEQRGKAAGRAEFGKRLARTQFDAAAGRRNPDVDTAAVLEYVDLARFVGDDGEPDGKAIQAAVDRLVPAPPGGPPSFDGGTRTTSPAPAGMTALIRKAAGRA